MKYPSLLALAAGDAPAEQPRPFLALSATMLFDVEIQTPFSNAGFDRGNHLALLGPDAWSVDARLFGWKRIDLGNRRS